MSDRAEPRDRGHLRAPLHLSLYIDDQRRRELSPGGGDVASVSQDDVEVTGELFTTRSIEYQRFYVRGGPEPKRHTELSLKWALIDSLSWDEPHRALL